MKKKFKLEFCLFLNCSLKVCEERILKRAQTDGRADDNLSKYFLHCINYLSNIIIK